MRKLLLGFVVVLTVSMAVYLRFHHSRRAPEVAYAANHQVTLWSSAAQVREPIAIVSYGDRLDVLARLQDRVRVRTIGGITGWTTEANLLSAELWQKAQELEKATAAMPLEARGHTGVLTNMRLGPGRQSPRIRQLSKAIPVELFERQAVEVPSAPPAAGEQDESDSEPAPAKKEDWWLVRAHVPDEAAISGWVLGRFVSLDVPAPLPDYASAAGMRIVAWFELNRAANIAGHARPQYLVVGTRGPEGQPCDFTLLRVYTWSQQRQRYETAFVESAVCGKLPVKVTQPAARGGEVTFGFEDWSKGTSMQRTYLMRANVVRRVKDADPMAAAERHTHG
jgi:hypothetical protein